MPAGIDRRTFAMAATALAVGGLAPGADAAEALKLADAQAFSFEGLQALAKAMAASPYVPPPQPEGLDLIDYDAWGRIRFDPQHAVFAEGPGRFPVTFFHLGKFFRKTVEMHVVEDGRSRRIIYRPSYFDMPAGSIAKDLADGVGFAGLRFQEARDGVLDWRSNDWVAFLGASYFRAIGELHQYGLSARGIALDTAVAEQPEEFPDFIRFYIDAQHDDTVTLHALLDGPGITGAYRFQMKRTQSVTMDVTCSLFLRRDIARFGIAPLTTMYWPGPVDRRGPAHLAAARQSAAHHGLGLRGRESARLRTDAARPNFRSLWRWCLLRPPTEPVG